MTHITLCLKILRKLLVLSLLVTVVSTLIFLFHHSNNFHENTDIVLSSPKFPKTQKPSYQQTLLLPQKQKSADTVFPLVKSPKREEEIIILFWTRYLNHESCQAWMIDRLLTERPDCYHKCRIVKDRDFENRSDAIIFHSRNLRDDNLPTFRFPHQPWIYLQQLPPTLTEDLEPFANTFNWTMTYRKDSDIHHPYYKFIPVTDTPTLPNIYDIISTKTRPIAWIVSNCDASSRRNQIAQELSKFVTIDIYGACGPLRCRRPYVAACYPEIGPKYKFYLAFENSVCSEYITEKFFLSMENRMIPIVFGGGDYSAVAPEHSYINVNDFESPRALAEYLRFLDENHEKYLEYFWWVGKYKIVHGDGWCKLCEKLRVRKSLLRGENMGKTTKSKVYRNLSSWWRFIRKPGNIEGRHGNRDGTASFQDACRV